MISCATINLIRDRASGSKSLQLLSGTRALTYWLSNLIFDTIVFTLTISSLILSIKFVAMVRTSDDAIGGDTYVLAKNPNILAYLFLFMAFASFSWSIFVYVCSFVFTSDIVGFIVVLLVLTFACLIDILIVYFKLFDPSLAYIYDPLRYTFAFLFPNIAVKRAIFNLKLQELASCLKVINKAFKFNGIYVF